MTHASTYPAAAHRPRVPFRPAALAAAVVVISSGAVTQARIDSASTVPGAESVAPITTELPATGITGPVAPMQREAAADAAEALEKTSRLVATELDANARALYEDSIAAAAIAQRREAEAQRAAAVVDAGRALATTRQAIYGELDAAAQTLFQASRIFDPPQILRDLAAERLAADIDSARALTETQDTIVAELDRNASELFYAYAIGESAPGERLSAVESEDSGRDGVVSLASGNE